MFLCSWHENEIRVIIDIYFYGCHCGPLIHSIDISNQIIINIRLARQGPRIDICHEEVFQLTFRPRKSRSWVWHTKSIHHPKSFAFVRLRNARNCVRAEKIFFFSQNRVRCSFSSFVYSKYHVSNLWVSLLTQRAWLCPEFNFGQLAWTVWVKRLIYCASPIDISFCEQQRKTMCQN
jgi:hypothetical protein